MIILLITFLLTLLNAFEKPHLPLVIYAEKSPAFNGDDICKDNETSQDYIEACKSDIVTSTGAFVTFADSVLNLQHIPGISF